MSENQKNPSSNTLRRTLSLSLVTSYGLGTILGAGIYVLIGKVAGEAGGYTPLSFLLAAIIALFTALSYSELCANFPKASGETLFIRKAFDLKWLSTLIGVLIVASGLVSGATITAGAAGYMQRFYDLPTWVYVAGLSGLLLGLAIWNVEKSASVILWTTVLEVAGLLLVIFLAGADIPWGEALGQFQFEIDSSVFAGIGAGAFIAFYAFIGFGDMAKMAEETVNPQKNMPRAILLALAGATLLYMGVAVIAVLAAEPQSLAQSSAPLADLVGAETIYGNIISAISVLVVLNGALTQILMSSRLLYGMGSNSNLFAVFHNVWQRTNVPLRATLLSVLALFVLAAFLPIKQLAEITSYIVLTTFVLVNVSLVKLKTTKLLDSSSDTLDLPLFIPVLGALTSFLMLAFKTAQWLNA